MSLSRRFTTWVLEHRRAVLVVAVVLTAVLGAQLRLVSFSHNEQDEVIGDDPAMRELDRFYEYFGDDEILLVGLETERVFSNDVLAYMRRLCGELGRVEGVRRVVALTNATAIEGSGGLLDAQPFLGELPLGEEELRRKEREALANHFWAGDFISSDGRVAALHVLVPALTDDSTRRSRLVADVRRVLAESPCEGVRVHVAGISPIVADAMAAVKRDYRHFLCATPLLIAALLFVVFRTVRGVMLPLGVIGVAVVWTLGLFFTFGRSLSMMTTMMPTLVSIICLSDAIHILARYYELAAAADGGRREVVLRTMDDMAPACLLTSVTTAIGFGSLVVSELRSIREFALSAAVGIMLAYVLAVTIVPIVLSALPLPRPEVQRRYAALLSARVLRRVTAFVRRDRWVTPAASVALVGLSVAGIALLRVNVDVVDVMPQSAPAVRAQRFLQDRMAGYQSLELLIDGPPEQLKEPWALREVEELQQFTATIPGVEKVTSVVDLVKTFHRALSDDGERAYSIPDEPGRVDEYLLLLSMTDRADLMHAFAMPDFSSVRVSARIRAMGTSDYSEVIEQIHAFAAAHLDPRLSLRITGLVKIWTTKVTALVRSLLKSLVVAVAIIAVLMAVHFRSLRVAAACLIPNVLPAVVTLGLMGLLGVPLMVATSMVSAVAIGIAVDDGIHFMTRYRAERRGGRPLGEAIGQSLASCGRAIVFTSLIIAAGFSLFVFSGFSAIRWFGVLTAFTMLVALVGDLVLLPYLIRRLRVGDPWQP